MPLIQQPDSITCGQAVYTMGWNYKHPEKAMDVDSVAKDAYANGWNLGTTPYTTPDAMVVMGEYYSNAQGESMPITGHFARKDMAWLFLERQINAGNPVMVDVTVKMRLPKVDNRDAHFVIVIGVNVEKGVIYYNDPFGYDESGKKNHIAAIKAVNWDIFWNAWQNNSDAQGYGGSGWWMVVP